MKRAPREGLVPRPRLLQLLDDWPDARLLLIAAPAGFGKTTFLAQWLHTADAPVTAWMTLDATDNIPARFLRSLAAAVCLAAPEHQRSELRSFAEAPQPIAEMVVEAVLEALAAVPGRVVLVLDDYHAITEQAVHGLLVALLDGLPPNALLALATRVDPPLPLARLRAQRELLEIRDAQLRFSAEEADGLLNATLGLRLARDDVATLAARTEGWAAGLQLAGLSLRNREDPAAFVQAFSGTHRFILDYLMEEVLAHQPADVQAFLLATAILDAMCADLCESVTGEHGAQLMLERLERANLFVVALDDDRRWYRYHHLFAELLRAHLQQLQPERVPELHARAAAWFEAHGMRDSAVRHALATRDASAAVAVIKRHWAQMAHDGELDVVLSWLDAVPGATVRGDPELSIAYAWMLVLKGGTQGVAERLDDAEAASVDPTLPDRERILLALPPQVACLRSPLARRRRDYAQALDWAEQALARIPDELQRIDPAGADVLRGDALLERANVHAAAGDLDRAADDFRAAIPLLWAGRNALGVGYATLGLARVELARGRVEEAAAACLETLVHEDDIQISDSCALAGAHLGLGHALLAAGDVRRAEEHARRAAELARCGGSSWIERQGHAVLQRIMREHAPPRAGDLPGNATLAEPLSARELEVLQLLVAGHSNRRIADELVVAVGTVKAHVHSIYGKLGASGRVDAVARARALGLVP